MTEPIIFRNSIYIRSTFRTHELVDQEFLVCRVICVFASFRIKTEHLILKRRQSFLLRVFVLQAALARSPLSVIALSSSSSFVRSSALAHCFPAVRKRDCESLCTRGFILHFI